jgi:4-hydroxybenzoate polyprenyltransferase
LFFASSLVTFSIYNLNKITDTKEDTINNPERAKIIQNIEKNTGMALSIGAYIIALIIGLLTEKILAITILLIPLWVAILYSVPLVPGLPRLKDIFFAKSLSVTIGMTLSIFLLLYIFYPHPIILLTWVSFLFIKLFINTVLFDVRDLEGDKKIGIKTIPVIWGVRKTKNFLLFLNTLLILWIFVAFYLNLFMIALPIILFSVIFDYWAIQRFCKVGHRNVYNYDILVDGEWMFLCGIFIILNFVIFP